MESCEVAANETNQSEGESVLPTARSRSGVRKSARPPPVVRDDAETSASRSERGSPLLGSLLDMGGAAASRARMFPWTQAFRGFRGVLFCAGLAAVATALARGVAGAYAWAQRNCCKRGKKAWAPEAPWAADSQLPREDVRVLLCVHRYGGAQGSHRVYALTRDAGEEKENPPRALLNNTQFRDGVPFVANGTMGDDPSVLEVILGAQKPILQFVLYSPSTYIGKEKFVGLAWIDLNKFNGDFNFQNETVEVQLEASREDFLLDVSMWKYVEPRGFKVHDMWGRLACCLDQARTRLPSPDSTKVSSIMMLSHVLTGYFMVDADDMRSYKRCYFEATFKKDRWYWVWYNRKGGERKGFIPFGSLTSMRAHPTEKNCIILRYSKKQDKHELFIAPLANPETFEDAVRGRDELMFALWTLRESRSQSGSYGQDLVVAEAAKQGASSSDTEGSEVSNISASTAATLMPDGRRGRLPGRQVF